MKMQITTAHRLNAFNGMMKGIVSNEFTDWLVDNGFFIAPASTKYHGNYEGGLYDHSAAFAGELVHMTEALNLEWQRKESPLIIGMFHDLCKIDSYKKVIDVEGACMFGSDKVKGEQAHYEYNDKVLLTGHGEKSIMLLSQFMTLTEEEMLCIRYHMGAYNTNEWEQYGAAIEKYPNVLFSHTADMVASRILKT